ncbi:MULTISPECIES: DUF5360 family protein [Paenibacillus]|uniref:DUF5360 family protein n=1 Tax=Paenibacillus TaxID=44249 RepID=UPI001F397CB7|nr:DUF5360 family protein [Paenibacillus sp. JJ-223]CAH1207448.1 hypothetical protein PAECIP111890_03025 [Paenibacillus sp. JJ-223]
MGKTLKTAMLVTDLGFVVYWLIVFLQLLPKEFLYKDYDNEMMVAWNLSFIPLDLLISFTGLTSIYVYQKRRQFGISLGIISLTLTFCSGLQAIAFWGLRHDFDVSWWIPNLFLMIYPLFFLPRLIRKIS